MKALIAAGGHGTRFRPITWTMNKHLIPMANQPMIFNAIEKITGAGITEIAINVNPGDTEIEESVGDGSKWGASITYLEQSGGALGIAHAVNNAQGWIGDDSFMFYLGDNIVLGSLERFVDRFNNEGLHCLLALSHVPNPTHLGVAEFDETGKLCRVVEKPENPPSEMAVTGIYLYDSSFFEAFKHIEPSGRGEYEISDIHTWLLENDYKVGSEEITGWWKDTGMPHDLLEGNQLLMNDRPRDFFIHEERSRVSAKAIVQGLVRIEEGTLIGDNVIIRGPVTIGKNVVIENAYVGPYTAIGDNVKINGAELEHSILLEGSEINCEVRIVDSILGKNSVITNAKNTQPRSGHKIIIGENSRVEF